MVGLRLAVFCALGVLLLTPQAAAGGGWWSYVDVDRSLVAPGQRVELEVTVSFTSAAAAEAAQQANRFHVYLLGGFDDAVVERAMRKSSPDNWWSLADAEAIDLGSVTVSVSDTNLGRASAVFTVPQVPPATYQLMLCDTACTQPLANVIPTEDFTVVADRATAQMAMRVEQLARRSRNQADQLAAARAAADRALLEARTSRSDVEQLKTVVSSLANEGRRSPPPSAWAYAGWLVAGALVAALARSSSVAADRDRRDSPGLARGTPATTRTGSSSPPSPGRPDSRALLLARSSGAMKTSRGNVFGAALHVDLRTRWWSRSPARHPSSRDGPPRGCR